MRRMLLSCLLILLSVAVAMAQEPSSGQSVPSIPQVLGLDDHDDHGPVQSGYAVVTPVVTATSTNTTGLVVFETFGLREGLSGTPQAGVLPPDLTTNAVMFVDSSGRLSKGLGVAIVNPNSSNVNVTLTLRKSDGTQVASTIIGVPALQQISKFLTQLFSSTPPTPPLPSDITGSVSITSSGPSLSVIGLRFRGQNFSTIPVTNLSGNSGPLPNIASGVGGAGAVLLPQFATGGGWATELVLMNTSTSNLIVRVDLYKPDFTPLIAKLNGQAASSFNNLTIPPGGVLTLAPRDPNGDDDF